MLQLNLAGRLGSDATFRRPGEHDVCSFSVATDVGYGDNKKTIWVDVSRWGKGAQKLSEILLKGSAVAVSGEMSTREYEGKTYIQCRADKVTIQSTPQSNGGGGSSQSSGQQSGGPDDDADLDDSIPF